MLSYDKLCHYLALVPWAPKWVYLKCLTISSLDSMRGSSWTSEPTRSQACCMYLNNCGSLRRERIQWTSQWYRNHIRSYCKWLGRVEISHVFVWYMRLGIHLHIIIIMKYCIWTYFRLNVLCVCVAIRSASRYTHTRYKQKGSFLLMDIRSLHNNWAKVDNITYVA